MFTDYKNDGEPSIDLDENQKKEIAIVKEKIHSGVYQFREITHCPCCDVPQIYFEIVAEKDRYGFANRNVICTKCGLMFSNPMWEDESVTNFYEKHYRAIYRAQTLDIATIFNQSIPSFTSIYEYLWPKIPQNARILDIGCGGGDLSLCEKWIFS